MVELALRTGIPIREWVDAPDADIATAITVLAAWDRSARRG